MGTINGNEVESDRDNAGPKREFEVGVLFVHGIGEQRIGETLRGYADPIVDWIREWLYFGEGNRAKHTKLNRDELVHINAGSFLREDDDPPHFDLTIHSPTTSKDGKLLEKPAMEKWRLVECHWADVFPTPTTYEVVKWTIPVLPAALVSHFARRLAISRGQWPSNVRDNLMAFVLILPVLVVTTTAMLALLLLSLIPIDRLKAFVTLLQQKLALVIGDSYVFIQSPSRRAAILNRFRQDLKWLGEKCEHAVIVAHSQGAAVAFQGMHAQLPQNLKLFVTLGAGVHKLWVLRSFREHGMDRAFYFVLFMAVCLTLLLLVPLSIAPNPAFVMIGSGVLLVVCSIIYYIAVRMWNKNVTNKQQELTDDLGWPDGPAWHDFFAYGDPVANGPLPDWFRSTRSKRIANRGSLISDHTAYEQNIHQFIAPLVHAIGEHTGSAIPLHYNTKDETYLLDKADRRRNAFVRCLVIVRWSIIVSLGLNLWLAPGWTQPIRDLVFPLVSKLPGGDWIGADRLALTVALVALAFNLYWLFFQLWSNVVRTDLRALQRRSPHGTVRNEWALYLTVLFVAALLLISPFATELWRSLMLDQKVTVLFMVFVPVPFTIFALKQWPWW